MATGRWKGKVMKKEYETSCGRGLVREDKKKTNK
jgi:hypothetical protein